MNRIKAAEDKLRKLEGLRLAMENIPVDLQFLERATEDSRKMEELRKSLVQTRRQVYAIENALGALSPEEKLVLHRFFICPQRRPAEQLCQELGLEQSTVYRRRSSALEKFTLALYGDTAP